MILDGIEDGVREFSEGDSTSSSQAVDNSGIVVIDRLRSLEANPYPNTTHLQRERENWMAAVERELILPVLSEALGSGDCIQSALLLSFDEILRVFYR